MDLLRSLDSLKCLARVWPYGSKLRQLFDAEFYLHKYPDVAAAGVNPLHHYIEHGAKERRKPHPLFDPEYYSMGCSPSTAPKEPLIHFLRGGSERWINPHPLFDCASYLAAHPDALKRRLNPLLHWVYAHRGRVHGPVELKHLPFEAIRLTFMDVPITVAFADEPAAGDDVARVWEDESGRMRFVAPPEQRPFFEAMKYDQLRAQFKQPR